MKLIGAWKKTRASRRLSSAVEKRGIPRTIRSCCSSARRLGNGIRRGSEVLAAPCHREVGHARRKQAELKAKIAPPEVIAHQRADEGRRIGEQERRYDSGQQRNDTRPEDSTVVPVGAAAPLHPGIRP